MDMQQCSVLVVDDEPMNILILSEILNCAGYRVTEATSGLMALDAIAKQDFDAVLLDVMMPGMDGYEVLTKIRMRYSQTELPVIVVTALDGNEHIVRALELGANDFVQKPVNKSVVLARLQNQLAMQQASVAKQESDRRYRDLFNQANVLIQSVCADGSFEYANPTWHKVLGYDADELKTLSLFDIIHPESQAHCRAVFERLKAGESIDHVETLFLSKAGDVVVVEGNVASVCVNGQMVSSRSIFRDVTDKRKVEHALEEKSRLLFAFQKIGWTALTSLNLDQVLDTLVEQIVHAGIFRSLMVALVDEEALLVNVVRSMFQNSDGKVRYDNDRVVGISYDLKDQNITAEIARTGEMVVVDGWDDRFDERLRMSDAAYSNSTFYFLPIKQGNRVLAVLATASNQDEKDETLRHIEMIMPLLDQVAIVLCQVMLHQDLLKESQKLEKTNRQLQQEMVGRKQLETSLLYQNTLLTTQQEVTLDGILVVDKNGDWISCNSRFVAMWHIPPEVEMEREHQAALDAILSQLVDPQAFLDRMAYLNTHQSEKSREEVELVDGRVFDRFSAPMFGPQGQYYGRVWYYRDVTDYKRIERALRNANDELEQRVAERTVALEKSEERFLQLAENIHQAFYVVSIPDRQSLYISPAFEEIWGLPLKRVDEQPEWFLDSIFEADRAKVVAALEKENLGLATTTEYRIVRTDGSIRWVWDQGFPVKNEKGEVFRVVGIIEDITERKLLSEKLFQSQKMEAVGQLAGGVAHDFNNLLTVINGYSKMGLKNLEDDAPLRTHLEEIHNAGERAQGLTRQLLAFSRKQMLQPCVLDVNKLVVNLQKMLQRLIGENIVLSATLCAKGQVMADPTQLDQVILNLIINAGDAMPRGGKLKIETKDVVLDAPLETQCQIPTGHYVRLSVIDTGIGMDQTTQEHIFEPFYTTKEQGKGTGLGLSMVYGIVAQSGGGIEVVSALGQGTTFHIYLPQYFGSTEADEIVEVVAEKGGAQGTVLVAEDEDIVRLLTVTVLQEAGYTVLDARSGEEACRLFDEYQGKIDLLVTDLVMPQMSGKDLADQLLLTCPDIKVLYVSGYTDDVINNHGVLGMDVPFLLKPYMPEELSEKVREVMETGI